MSLPTPSYSLDRTIITVAVIVSGTALLWHYGDASPIVALVSSMWTLTLTFWFRWGSDNPTGGR